MAINYKGTEIERLVCKDPSTGKDVEVQEAYKWDPNNNEYVLVFESDTWITFKTEYVLAYDYDSYYGSWICGGYFKIEITGKSSNVSSISTVLLHYPSIVKGSYYSYDPGDNVFESENYRAIFSDVSNVNRNITTTPGDNHIFNGLGSYTFYIYQGPKTGYNVSRWGDEQDRYFTNWFDYVGCVAFFINGKELVRDFPIYFENADIKTMVDSFTPLKYMITLEADNTTVTLTPKDPKNKLNYKQKIDETGINNFPFTEGINWTGTNWTNLTGKKSFKLKGNKALVSILFNQTAPDFWREYNTFVRWLTDCLYGGFGFHLKYSLIKNNVTFLEFIDTFQTGQFRSEWGNTWPIDTKNTFLDEIEVTVLDKDYNPISNVYKVNYQHPQETFVVDLYELPVISTLACRESHTTRYSPVTKKPSVDINGAPPKGIWPKAWFDTGNGEGPSYANSGTYVERFNFFTFYHTVRENSQFYLNFDWGDNSPVERVDLKNGFPSEKWSVPQGAFLISHDYSTGKPPVPIKAAFTARLTSYRLPDFNIYYSLEINWTKFSRTCNYPISLECKATLPDGPIAFKRYFTLGKSTSEGFTLSTAVSALEVSFRIVNNKRNPDPAEENIILNETRVCKILETVTLPEFTICDWPG